MTHPIIGITGARHEFISRDVAPNLFGVVSADDYALAVEDCGGIPFVIPHISSAQGIHNLAERLDGLILGGGEDPDPALYGQPPKRGVGTVIRQRDDLELQLIQHMMTANKPIFGICRGIQILNVAFGGTLWQDLPREWTGTIAHHQRAARTHLSHPVDVSRNSRLYHIVGEVDRLMCNSFHHQAVRDVGTELRAVAWDDEGLVEAIEHPSYPFVIGVQWHPENLWQSSEAARRLFVSFVDAAASSLTP